MEETFKSFLFDVSAMIDDVTALDTIKQLITEMDHIVKESRTITVAAEEMSSSVIEVTDQSVTVAKNTEDAVDAVANSKEIINQALDTIQRVGGVYQEITSQVQQLNHENGQLPRDVFRNEY